jgi:hypothetical protein
LAHSGPAPSSPAEVTAALVEGLDPSVEWILIAHSNAGIFVPAIARARPVRAAVYADARVPMWTGEQAYADDERLESMRRLTDEDGLVKPWPQWWAGIDLADHYPSAEVRAEVEAQARRLPLTYFAGAIDGTGWNEIPSAYLAFGEGYATVRDPVAALGWPVHTIDGVEHLHQLIDPVGVTDQLLMLLTRLDLSR